MAKRRVGRKPIKETIDKFFGLNLTGETQLKKGESPNMTNFYITDNYDLNEIYGYSQMMKTVSLTKPIRGKWCGTLNGAKHFLFACNGHIYKVTNGYWDDDTTWETTEEFTTHTIDLGTLTDNTTRFFDFGGKVYFQNGAEYKCWNGKAPATATMTIADPCVVTLNNHGFLLNQNIRFTTTGELPTGLVADTTYYVISVDTNTFKLSSTENGTAIVTTGTQSGVHTLITMFSNVEGYAPKIRIGCIPATGAIGTTGAEFEGNNQLTGKKHITYNGDGTAVYQLPEKAIASVDFVYVDGTLRTLTTHYTVDLTTGVVTFTSGNLPAIGLDNVDIYWNKATADRDVIVKNKAMTEFKNRIFMYGNPNQPNAIIYSALANGVPSAEYFPAFNYQPVGKENSEITDITKGYDRIVITKPNKAFFATYDSFVADGQEVVNFPISDLNDAVGNTAFAQGQVIDNYPLTIENGLQQWISTDVKDERNVKDVSLRIKSDLNKLDLSKALTMDFNERNEYWVVIGRTLYIYNYGLYGFENDKTVKGVFSRIQLKDTVTCISNIDGEIYFGTDDGKIMKFSEGSITFNGDIINSHWESGFLDKGANYLTKTMDKIWIGLQPQTKSYADVNFVTNLNAGDNPESVTHQRQIFTLGSVDFSDFSFAISSNPQPKLLKLKAKKFTYLKITIDNNSATETCKILNMTMNINYGGESK